jgi:hypothetical protein
VIERLGLRIDRGVPGEHVVIVARGFIDIGLDAEEMDLLRRVDGRRTIDELCAVGPYSSGENAMLLFAFKVLSLVCPASKSVVSEDVASDISVEA